MIQPYHDSRMCVIDNCQGMSYEVFLIYTSRAFYLGATVHREKCKILAVISQIFVIVLLHFFVCCSIFQLRCTCAPCKNGQHRALTRSVYMEPQQERHNKMSTLICMLNQSGHVSRLGAVSQVGGLDHVWSSSLAHFI
jgi:hypothetical protein